MKREYLGDSYDAVKRLWRDLLQEWAPVHAESRFIPNEMQKDFTHLTGIPILTVTPQSAFSILNDPDTGIRLPGEKNQSEGRTHISVASIATQLRNDRVKCVITFDQSHHRQNRGSHKQQRCAKMEALGSLGFRCMYYVSHAPFCFALRTEVELTELKGILRGAGIPATRLEELEKKAEQSHAPYR
jgi:hypothetical protein